MNRNFWIIFLVSGCIAIAAVISISGLNQFGATAPAGQLISPIRVAPDIEPPIPASSPTAPASVFRCTELEAKAYDIVGTATEQDKQFYYLRLYWEVPPIPSASWYDVIQVTEKAGCERLRGREYFITGLRTLTHNMKLETARDLEKQRYRSDLQKYDRSTLQQRLQQQRYFTGEQIWALEQLKITVPSGVERLNNQAIESGTGDLR